MGTNYYLRQPRCPHCNRDGAELHIGKSSAGWNFGLCIYTPEDDAHHLKPFGVEAIRELDDWRPLFKKFEIYDEYGDKIEADEMISQITDRSHPNGLLSRVTAGPEHMGPYGRFGRDDLYPGKGTYDLCHYPFS